MSDYINIKKLKKKKVYSFQTVFGVSPKNEWFYKYDDIHSIPPADILEHARAIKEYCKERTKKPIWCNDCPLYEAFCKNSTPPNMWDLPIGEKET